MTIKLLRHTIFIIALPILASCSMTKGLPEDDQLFTGLKKTIWTDAPEESPYQDHLEATMDEVEAALATEPNGSLFGSSHYTVPWSWHLWVYNKYSGKNSKFAKWMTKSFGKPPVLMSKVNPTLRASVARSVLQNNGYFRGNVTYELFPQKNPKKCKIGYTVTFDSLYTIDAMQYVNFPREMQALIDSTSEDRAIRSNDPFSVNALDAERNRVSLLFRNNGYYYYNTNYASYLADTFAVDNKASLRFQMAEGLPPEALHKWYIGNIDILFRRSMAEQLTDSIKRRHLTIHYSGKKSPIRPSVILKDMRLRPRQEYSYDKLQESASLINSNGVFSNTDFRFTPRPNTDTLDLRLSCTFDKPYDFYIEGNAIGRTNGRYGPMLKVGITKRNTFRAAEKLDINLHGSYDFSMNDKSRESNYQVGADVSLEFPRLIIPFYDPFRIRIKRDENGRIIRRRRFFATPTTLAKISADVISRPDYYRMTVVSGEWTYSWQRTATSRHEFSPLTVKYQFKNTVTAKFDSLVQENPYLNRTMGDYFIPKMRYTYIYTSPTTLRHPIRWEATIEESANLLSLAGVIFGKDWNARDKRLFNNPYAQFLKFESDFTKTWSVGDASSLVGHVNTSVVWSYGNNMEAPYSEEYYVGGANSIRAFAVRDIGPGAFSDRGASGKQWKQWFYLMRNGDLKFVANLEYRMPLFGNMKGAVFLDAGNVWRLKKPDDYDSFDADYKEWLDDMFFKPSRFLNDIALGTGLGLRYDMGFLVVRVDWGIALHLPCNNGISKYFFNVERFRDLHTLHFAIGYPF